MENEERYHIYPTDDTHTHLMSIRCPCNPEWDEEDNLVIHNSFDGREDFESGKRKPS